MQVGALCVSQRLFEGHGHCVNEIGGATGGESINDGLGARLAVGVHGGLGQLDARVGAEGDDGDEVAGVEHLDDDF